MARRKGKKPKASCQEISHAEGFEKARSRISMVGIQDDLCICLLDHPMCPPANLCLPKNEAVATTGCHIMVILSKDTLFRHRN